MVQLWGRFSRRTPVGCYLNIITYRPVPLIMGFVGVRTIDIGIPQLAMHSIREMCGVGDVTHGVNLMDAFFTEFPNVDAAIVPAD